jgi:hypothetical protein
VRDRRGGRFEYLCVVQVNAAHVMQARSRGRAFRFGIVYFSLWHNVPDQASKYDILLQKNPCSKHALAQKCNTETPASDPQIQLTLYIRFFKRREISATEWTNSAWVYRRPRERISRGRRSSRLRGNEFPRAKGECPVLHDEAGTMLHKRPTTFVLGEPAVNDAIDGYTPWHNAALPPHYLSNRTRRTYTLHPATTQPTRTFRGARESSRQVTVAHHVARGAAHLTRNSAQTLDFPTVHIIILVTCIWPSFHANF